MNELVFIHNGGTVTDSLTVAEVFGKEHKNVLRDIERLECSEEFNRLNFERIDYIDSRSRKQNKFIITQDGFTMLAMGYTGKEAARFKEKYINEFNRMKRELADRALKMSQEAAAAFKIPQTLPEALRLAADLADKNTQLEQENGVLLLKAEADRPKVIFAEALETSGTSILVGELAKILKQNGIEIGQNRMFQMLRSEGYLGKKGEYYNIPTQRSMELKLFEIVTRTLNNPDGSVRTTKTTKVTGKGQSYFINKLKGRMVG